MKKILLIGVVAALAAWIYTGGGRHLGSGVAQTAATKTDIFN